MVTVVESAQRQDLIINKKRGIKSPTTNVSLASGGEDARGTLILRVCNDMVTPEYVYLYLITQNPMMDYYEHRGMLSSLNTDNFIAKTVVKFPTLREQRVILHVNQLLKNKINVNLEINETLKKLAMTFFELLTVDLEKTQPLEDFLSASMFFGEKQMGTGGKNYIEADAILRTGDFDEYSYGEQLITWGKIADADFLTQNHCHFGRNDYTLLSAKSGISPLLVYCAAKTGVARDDETKSTPQDFFVATLCDVHLQKFHEKTNVWFSKIQYNLQQNATLRRLKNTFNKAIFSQEISLT